MQRAMYVCLWACALAPAVALADYRLLATSQEQDQVLDRVLEATGPGKVVVFDLDSTVIDNRPGGTPVEFKLDQNYPNPFNPTTTIHFSIPHHQHVTLRIFDILGREIATLIDTQLESGSHSAIFNATNLPSGMYVYRIQSSDTMEQKKMVLMK